MNEDFYISLIYKQLQGELPAKEKGLLEKGLAASAENEQLAKEIRAVHVLSEGYLESELKALNVEQAFQEQLVLMQPTAKIRKIRPIYNWRNWAAAAAVLLLVVLGWQEFTKPIALPMKTVVAIGGKYKTTLPDGSVVWLKGNSRIRYAKQLQGDTRRIELTGTAVFDVARDETQPFIVDTKIGQVKVLGTKFSLAYDKEEAILDLRVLEGKVNIWLKGGNKNLDVAAGARVEGFYDNQKLFKTKEKDNQLAWFDNRLVFDDMAMRMVVKTLETHYKTKITLDDTALATCKFSSIFENQPLEYVLETIEQSLGVSWQQQDSTYMIKGVCK